MKFLIILVAAVGVVSASPQGFLQNTPEVQEATINFINEYNRLAKLAADAPDIHIYHDDARLQRVELAPVHHHQHVPHQQRTSPFQGLNTYSYTTNLGSNTQFQPTHQFRRTFEQVPQVHHAVVTPKVHHAVITPQFQNHQPVQFLSALQPAPVQRWNGPWAHTVPAGVNGLPTQGGFTPEVEEARNAHFRALHQAYQSAAAASAAARSQSHQKLH